MPIIEHKEEPESIKIIKRHYYTYMGMNLSYGERKLILDFVEGVIKAIKEVESGRTLL
jgi:hypothetical protein